MVVRRIDFRVPHDLLPENTRRKCLARREFRCPPFQNSTTHLIILSDNNFPTSWVINYFRTWRMQLITLGRYLALILGTYIQDRGQVHTRMEFGSGTGKCNWELGIGKVGSGSGLSRWVYPDKAVASMSGLTCCVCFLLLTSLLLPRPSYLTHPTSLICAVCLSLYPAFLHLPSTPNPERETLWLSASII